MLEQYPKFDGNVRWGDGDSYIADIRRVQSEDPLLAIKNGVSRAHFESDLNLCPDFPAATEICGMRNPRHVLTHLLSDAHNRPIRQSEVELGSVLGHKGGQAGEVGGSVLAHI